MLRMIVEMQLLLALKKKYGPPKSTSGVWRFLKLFLWETVFSIPVVLLMNILKRCGMMKTIPSMILEQIRGILPAHHLKHLHNVRQGEKL